jgi:hypothetical protein
MATTPLPSASLTGRLDRLEQQLAQQSPFSRWEIVSVTFTNADQDVDIRHNLTTARPESVHYLVLQQSKPGTISHDTSATRKKWPKSTVILRSSAASMRATILLVLLNLAVSPTLVR